MSSSSANWKNSEAYLQKLYQLYGLDASLESKEGRFQSRSTYDVRINNPSEVEFCSDSKYSKASWRHHSLIEKIEKLYCKKGHQMAVLFTKNFSKHGGVISCRDTLFVGLLAYWLGALDRQQVLSLWKVSSEQ